MIFCLPFHICFLALCILLSALGTSPVQTASRDSFALWLLVALANGSMNRRSEDIGELGWGFILLAGCPWVAKSHILCLVVFSTHLPVPQIMVSTVSSCLFRPKCSNDLVVSLYFAQTFVAQSLNHLRITQLDFTICLLLVS